MTDGDDRTEDRIRAAFVAERRRAEADLQLEPLERRARRRSRLVTRLAVAAIVVAVAVGTAGVIGSLPGRTTSGPSAEPTASSSSSTGPTAGPTAAPTTTPVSRPTVDMTGRYPDGIPTTFDGQPVIRWDAALAKRDTAKDATPFLTGAWLNIPLGVFFCPAAHADPSAPATTWLVDLGCRFDYVSTEAGGQPTTQMGVTTFQFYSGQLTTGPAIMRAHIHDPRAAQCGYQKAICDRMIVVDDIVWSGDAVTAPHPLTVADVLAATTQASQTSGLRAPGPDVFGCAANATDGLIMCPQLEPGVQYTSPIAGAVLLPSTEALARAVPKLEPGVDGALMPSAVSRSQGGTLGSWDYRELVVDNVIIEVRTSVGRPSDSDLAFLDRLFAALKAQETGS
jgi:hypothetical protein